MKTPQLTTPPLRHKCAGKLYVFTPLLAAFTLTAFFLQLSADNRDWTTLNASELNSTPTSLAYISRYLKMNDYLFNGKEDTKALALRTPAPCKRGSLA